MTTDMPLSGYGECWDLRSDTVYLNHGSFGPPPRVVQQQRDRWQRRLDEQPMDFFLRQYEPAWFEARRQLARFLATDPENLVFVDNATVAMNAVADSFPLGPGDQVLLNDHEYGAVLRIWQRACRRAGAAAPRVARLPVPMESSEQVVEALFADVTPATRLIVVSHITSATAIRLPVAEICRRAAERKVSVCIDGPHAPAQVPVELDALGCDFYTASCHKWLSAPFGSGFLYVAPRHHSRIVPSLLSWGRGPSEQHRDWSDEFLWSGTRSPAAFLAVPAAIEFLEQLPGGVAAFREHTHQLARYARQRLLALTGTTPLVPDSDVWPDSQAQLDSQGQPDREAWYGSMAHVPLPRLPARPLQHQLWTDYRIEVPIIDWNQQTAVRVSCHLYNTTEDIDRLVEALGRLLGAA